ncbi:MAG: PAS domain-containing protein [Armatimonadota bacterium]
MSQPFPDPLELLTGAAESLLSNREPAQLVPAILDTSERLFQADAYAIWRYFPEDREWRAIADRNLSPEYVRRAPEGDWKLLPDHPVFTPDVLGEPRLAVRRAAYEAEGVRSMLYLPLRICGVKAGTIVFYFRQPRELSEPEIRLARLLSNLSAAALTNAETFQTQRRATEAASRAERRLQFLAEASAVLAASLDLDETLRHVARLAVPHLADWCTIHLQEEGVEIRLAAVAHADPEKVRMAEQLTARYPVDTSQPRGIGQVLRTGEPELFPEVPDELLVQRARDPEHLELLRGVGFRACIMAPLRLRDRTLGVLTFISAESGHAYDEGDLRVAEALAARAASAIENARLFRQSQQALAGARAAEDALRRTATHLRLAVSHSHLGDWSWDAATDLVDFSPRAAEIFGIPPGPQLTWTAMQALLHPEDRERARREVERVVAERGDYEIEYRILHPDAAERWVRATGRATYSSSGQVEGMTGLVEDVTDRREAEAALRASDERYRTFVAQSSEGIWRFELDQPIATSLPPEAQVEAIFERAYLAECNDAMARMYGFTAAEELVGARLTDLMDPGDPQNSDYLRAFVESGYHLSEAESHELDRYGDPVILSNNLIGIVEDGTIVRAWGTQRDITAQRRAEQALRDSEERLLVATRAAGIGTFDWHVPTGRVIRSEQELRLFGLDPDSEGYTGTSEDWKRALVPEDLEWVSATISQALEEGRQEIDIAYRIVCPNGEIRWIEGSARVLYDAERKPLRMVGVNYDTTERHRLEEELRHRVAELRQETRRKDEFLAMLAHELRNPLAPIVTASEIIRLRALEDAVLARQRETIERNAQHLARLVDDLLEVSRINEGKIELRRERMHLQDVVEQAVSAVQGQVESRDQELTVSLPPEPIELNADPTRLVQVFVNLLQNASKYTDRCGSLSLAAQLEGKEAVIRVRDTGRGIPPELLPCIFDLFVQGERSLARTEGGLGIGLTLVKRLVELHDGTVSARSEGPGRGAELEVRLPSAAPSTPVESEVEQQSPPTVGGRRVLVVEDNHDAAETLSDLLRLWGHEVEVASHGRAALELALAFEPAIVLLDIGLPDLDGYEVARLLQEELAVRALLVALTGYGREEDRRRALEAGFHAHLVKPVDAEELRQLLTRPEQRRSAAQ